MITDLNLTGFNLLCGVDERLATLHRELRFIARTLVRLRHRHHAALVFSSKRSSQQTLHGQPYFATELQRLLEQQSPAMLKRLFLLSPPKARFDGVESAPSTSGEEERPSMGDSGRAESGGARTARPSIEQQRRWTPGASPPRLELPLSLAPPVPRRKPLPRPRPLSCGADTRVMKSWASDNQPANSHNQMKLDIISFIIDCRSQALFSIPHHHIPAKLLATHSPESITIPPHSSTDSQTSRHKAIYLATVTVAGFSDFASWTRTDRILPHPPRAVDREWYMEACARRLVAALALGITLGSEAYGRAAMTEFHALGPLLDWPEDYVNAIFAVTAKPARACVDSEPSHSKLAQQWDAAHPARKLIVSLVAGKTSGPGRLRRVRHGPRDRERNVEEGHACDTRIRSGTFWGMFDWYCAVRGGEGGKSM